MTLTPVQFRRVADAISDPCRYHILHEIYSRIAVTPGQLAKLTTLSKPTISYHIDRLAVAGLIHIQPEGRTRQLIARHETWSSFLQQLSSMGKEQLLLASSSSGI
jgi:DNA-binding transcriptional ArsR family regulator